MADFIWGGGSAPTNATSTNLTDQASLPIWYQEYLRGSINQASKSIPQNYTQYTSPRIADFAADTKQSFADTRANQGNWEPYVNTAGNLITPTAQYGNTMNNAITSTGNTINSYNPAMQTAMWNTANATQPLAGQINTAMGNTAANSVYNGNQMYNQFFNPYADKAMDILTTKSNRNFNEQIMPGVMSTFTGGGQFGSSRNQDFAARAIRDQQENLLNAQNQVYNQAWTGAQSNYADWANRGLTGANQYGTLANTLANTNLTGANQYGTLANTQATTDLAGALQQSTIADTQQKTNIAGGQNLSALAGQLQSLGLKDAAALDTIGRAQQQQTQANYDMAYQDFLNQQNWGKDQAAWLASIIQGYPAPGSSQSSVSASLQPIQGQSPIAGLAGGVLTGVAATQPQTTQPKRKGGLVSMRK